MNRDELRQWRCSNGHVMGLVKRNGNGVRVLMLFREAIPSPMPYPQGVERGEEENAEVDVMAVVEGYVTGVKCSICGSMRTWVPGEEQLRELLKRALREQERSMP